MSRKDVERSIWSSPPISPAVELEVALRPLQHLEDGVRSVRAVVAVDARAQHAAFADGQPAGADGTVQRHQTRHALELDDHEQARQPEVGQRPAQRGRERGHLPRFARRRHLLVAGRRVGARGHLDDDLGRAGVARLAGPFAQPALDRAVQVDDGERLGQKLVRRRTEALARPQARRLVGHEDEGHVGERRRARMSSANAHASMVGRCTSVTTRSGRARPARISPSQPSAAQSTRKPDCTSWDEITCCDQGSSSMTSTRMVTALTCRPSSAGPWC